MCTATVKRAVKQYDLGVFFCFWKDQGRLMILYYDDSFHIL